VWIGSAGVSRFLGPPRPLRAADPPVWIERVFLNGRSLPLSERPRLPNQPRAVTFRFVSPSFTDENAIRFSYRLTGLSEDWTDGEPGQGEVTYARMGAGDYQFEVVARTADGRVSGTPATFGFEVRPLWWRTLPAIAVASLLVVGSTVLLIHLRERQLVAARRHLEREVAARTDDLRLANERLAALAVTDELTGVANRRRLMERLDEAMAFARRRRTPLAVVLADLDYFKLVNDRLGHSAGDTVLRQVARAMEDVLRTEDLLGRYGGDEFMAVLPGTDKTGAQDAAERLRRAVEEVDFGTDVAALLEPRSLTISVGVAAFEASVKDAAELVRRADDALYRSKEGGRNRVSGDEATTRQSSDAPTDTANDA
jgi:diguanylate cyclase (GGDEF)-like protein